MYSFKDEKGDELILLRDYVLVEMEQIKEKTESGLYMPETSKAVAQGRVDKGILVCIAEGISKKDFGIKDFQLGIGDVVYVQRYAGIELDIDKKPYKIVKVEDIYAVFKKAKEETKKGGR